MRFPTAIFAAFLCLIAQSALALPSNLDGDPPLFGNSKHFAWAQNAGWVNAQPFGYTDNGVQVTPLTVSGLAWAQNLGWVSFGSGSPQNGLRYSQQTTTTGADFGVNMDWQGNLSGYAWSQNAGWINFGWNTNAADSARPRFIAASNTFTGFAWSQNLGWINLGEGWLKTAPGTVTYADSDLDGIPDSYELAQTGNLTTWNNATDADGDGLLDGWEFTYFLALDVSDGSQDSDGDGWSDRVEFNARFNGLFPVNPARADLPAAWPAPPEYST
ncbi:MAG: hypothetical protein RL380_1752, partial [Verrucomicrobiota bacterium]